MGMLLWRSLREGKRKYYLNNMSNINIMTFVALIISIISLIWTILNQRGQNFRWAKLNAANLGIREIKMLPFMGGVTP